MKAIINARSLSSIRAKISAKPIVPHDATGQISALEAAAKKYGFTQNVTGDAVLGDEVIYLTLHFSGGSFGRFRRAPKFTGYGVRAGRIIKDSYGRQRGQHTFTLEDGRGEKWCVKGRNLYREVCLARPRAEEERAAALEEKHARGDAARKAVRTNLEWLAVGEGYLTKAQAEAASLPELKEWRRMARRDGRVMAWA